MSRRYIHIFCGVGMGKTSAALGKGFREASSGKSVVVIRFLKKKHTCEREEFFKQLEPQIRLFRFEKFPQNYESLTEQEKEEENLNIKNGLNFARKVIQTEECDVLILDEILGLTDRGIVTIGDRDDHAIPQDIGQSFLRGRLTAAEMTAKQQPSRD